jgi:hypothetical protein
VADRHEVRLSREPEGNLAIQVKLLREGGHEMPTDDGRPAIVTVPEALNDEGRLRVNFANKILLAGWQVWSRNLEKGAALSVTLDWLPLGREVEDSAVFIHLLDKDGRMWGQHDAIPLGGTYPPVFWVKGKPFRDHHILDIEHKLPPGEYTLSVGMYVMRTGQRWPVLDRKLAAEGQSDRVLLGPFRVEQ